MRKTALFVLVALIITGAAAAWTNAAAPAFAASAQPTATVQPAAGIAVSDNEVNSVAKQLYCPVCENIPLDVCPTQACFQWRELIRQKIGLGWSTEQIRQYFAVQYGDRVLSVPPTRGLNWLVYILPPVAFLAGGFLVFQVLRKMRAAGSEKSAATRAEAAQLSVGPRVQPAADPYMNRIEEDLKKRK
jgi:cytochrome c-type biogenesis protein CcmH